MQVSFRGDVTPETRAFALEMVHALKDIPHVDYQFNENHKVMLNSIDAKSDNVNINLHESTAVDKGVGSTTEVLQAETTGGMLP